MTLHHKESAPFRFGYSSRLIRLLAAGMATLFAGVSMADEVTVTLSNLTHTYDGSPKSATVTTSPIVAACTVTYEGSTTPPTTTPPTNAGSYAVVASVDAPNTGPDATGTLVISPATQTITFPALTNKTYGAAPFNLTATSSSGLPVSYMSSDTAVATISGSTVTIMGAGSTNITASQSGNLNYLPATSVVRSQLINKADQIFTMDDLPAKTYGDAAFTVTATANSGISIAKWESSDPTVATIHSTSGEVTIVGAGQTSIIASNTGNTNYNAAWIAKPLNVARSLAALPSGTQTVTYNGSAQELNPSTLPSGQASEITYRNTTAAEPNPIPQVIFQNGADTLALSYFSTGLQVKGYMGMAKYVSLGGSARKLHSCDVTLVTWAGYYRGKIDNDPTYRYKEWADAHPALVELPPNSPDSPAYPAPSVPGNSGGYYHPVTLSFYDYSNNGAAENYRMLTTQTVQAFIPWRPENDTDGSAYPNSGYAFRVPFTFPDGIILPQEVLVAVSFNTESYGTSPIGTKGPYNALNIPNSDGQQAGSTLLGNLSFIFAKWRWQGTGGGVGPMLRLRAVPTSASSIAPVDVGTYEIKTWANAFDEDPASVSTMRIGHTFASWQSAAFAGSGLPQEQTSDIADPDGDGIRNFLEYAFNSNPLLGDQPSPTGLEQGGATMAFTYRRNLHALDLNYSIQGSTQLADSLSWAPVTPLSETTLSDDGATRVIQATVVKPANQPSWFLRLKVTP